MLKKTYSKKLTCLFMLLSFLFLNLNIPVYAADTNSPQIAVSSENLAINGTVDVTISNLGLDANKTDWIGLYNENDVPGNSSNGGVPSIWYKYMHEIGIENGNGTYKIDLSTISGLEAGKTYKLILFKNDSYNVEASVKFNITAISVDSSTIAMNDITNVTITNGTSYDKDWVGLYNENDKPGDSSTGGVPSIWWKYLKTDLNVQNGNGTFKFEPSTINGLQAGKTYKLVLLKDDGYDIEASVKINITASKVQKSIQAVQLKTKAGTSPQLPDAVAMNNSDGTSSQVSVNWDAISASQYAKAGSFTVEGTVQGINEKAKANVTVVEGDGPLYSFQILSDTHLQKDLSYVHDVNFANALKDINSVDPDSSRLIINGDVTDCGLKENWDAFSKILSQNKHPKVDAAFGNHDTWQENTWVDQAAYSLSKQNFLSYTGEPNIYYDYWLNDNHFIFLGSEKSNGNYAYLSDTQLKWFDETLAKNAASNKPIFVFIHQPLYDTVSGSKPGQKWNGIEQDEQVRNILAKYPQAILFTGHTHWEFGSKYTMYNEKICSMFNIPSCAYCWTDANTEDDISEGYYIDVYKDKVVVKGRNFTTKEWMPNAQYEVSYTGNEKNAVIKAVDNYASLQSTAPQLNNLTLTADKTDLTLVSGENAKLTCNGSLTNGTSADLTKGTIQYSSSNPNVLTVDANGVVTPTGVGTAVVTARVSLDGITESASQQITVSKIKTDTTLSAITIDGKLIDNFASDTLSYNVQLSNNTTKVPTVNATANDSDATAVVNQALSLPGTATVTVTSADGTKQNIYSINFTLSDSVINTVEKPVFDLDSNVTYDKEQKLSISCATNGATIRYTTDGTDPTVNSPVYSEPIKLAADTTVRAIAIKDGFKDSAVTSNTYSLNVASGAELIENGDFSNGAQNWTAYNGVDNSPSGVVDGQFKTTVGNVGSDSWSIELGSSNFKLSAGKKYRLTFDAKSTINRNIQPVIEHNDAGYTRYLDQVSALTADMKTYSYDFEMSADDDVAHLAFSLGNVSGTGTIAAHDIYIDNVSLKEIVETTPEPSFSVSRGTYFSAQSVAISCAQKDAVIRYTTDGTDPTANSLVYSGPITVTANTTIKAYTSKAGLTDSKVYGVTYKFAETAVPTFSVSSGTYTSVQTVAINCATEGATIRYTTDGTEPTEKSLVYSSPITVAANTTIKAYAGKECHTDSKSTSASYIINMPHEPVVTPGNGDANANTNSNPSTNNSTNTNVSNGNGTVTDISQNSVVSKDYFNAIKGQDKTITFNSNSTIWTFNGKDITSDISSDIDLSLKTVSNELQAKEAAKVKALIGKYIPMFSFSFTYEGKLPGKATVKIFAGTAWANKNITVFRYYADKNTYERIAVSCVDKDGYFSYATDHCSDYFILETSNVSELPQTGSPVDTAVLLDLGALLLIAGAIIIYTNRRVDE